MENSTKRETYPFGPPANVKTIIETWRDRSMPGQVTLDWLTKIGLSPNLAGKNLAALTFLGLTDSDGNTTEVAERLRTASSDEYPAVLEEIVRKAFAPVFAIRDPAIDGRVRLEDAFRKAEPSAQRPRMVTFFLGMCALAGIQLKDAPPTRGGERNRVGVRRMKRESPGATNGSGGGNAQKPVTQNEERIPQDAPALPPPSAGRLHPAVQAWIDEIPPAGTQWDRADFESWLAIFKASIERAYRI